MWTRRKYIETFGWFFERSSIFLFFSLTLSPSPSISFRHTILLRFSFWSKAKVCENFKRLQRVTIQIIFIGSIKKLRKLVYISDNERILLIRERVIISYSLIQFLRFTKKSITFFDMNHRIIISRVNIDLNKVVQINFSKRNNVARNCAMRGNFRNSSKISFSFAWMPIKMTLQYPWPTRSSSCHSTTKIDNLFR